MIGIGWHAALTNDATQGLAKARFHHRKRSNFHGKVTSSLAVRDALCTGFGVSLIPRIYVSAEIESGWLRTVLDDWSAVELSVYAVYPSRRHVVPKVRAFVDFLVEELGARAA